MSVQISAYIQEDTKAKMEQYSSLHGIKKGFLIQNALEHYLQSLYEIPNSVIVPSSITLSKESFENLDTIASNEPNEKLIELFKD